MYTSEQFEARIRFEWRALSWEGRLEVRIPGTLAHTLPGWGQVLLAAYWLRGRSRFSPPRRRCCALRTLTDLCLHSSEASRVRARGAVVFFLL